MGFDHPDAESYNASKMGVIYHLEGEHWDWDKPLGEIVPGKDYRTPTCQFCHMYQDQGKFTHTLAAKGIWRMGTVPPKSAELKSSLKDYPYGIKLPPLDAKLDIYSEESKKKREQWIEMCSNCHSPRWGRLYLENLDNMMFEMWALQDRAHLIMDKIAAADAFDPPVSERDPFPMGEVLADALGPDLLGDAIYGAFKSTGGKIPVYGPILGVYTLFMAGQNNPSYIENLYAEMWFADKAHAYKGTAHVQQDISWWYGSAKVFQKISAMESEAQKLLRAKEVDKKLLGKKGSRLRLTGMVGGIILLSGLVLFGMITVSRRKK
jgi:hydroxylamine dehydrogenase